MVHIRCSDGLGDSSDSIIVICNPLVRTPHLLEICLINAIRIVWVAVGRIPNLQSHHAPVCTLVRVLYFERRSCLCSFFCSSRFALREQSHSRSLRKDQTGRSMTRDHAMWRISCSVAPSQESWGLPRSTVCRLAFLGVSSPS